MADVYRTKQRHVFLYLRAGSSPISPELKIPKQIGTIQFWKTIEVRKARIVTSIEEIEGALARDGFSIQTIKTGWWPSFFGRLSGKLRGEDEEDWMFIGKALSDRYLNFAEYYDEIAKAKFLQLEKPPASEKALTIATTDVFVEKAQKHLCSSARRFLACGIICAILAVIVTAYTAHLLYKHFDEYSAVISQNSVPNDIGNTTAVNNNRLNGYEFVRYVLTAAAFSGFTASLIFILFSLSRSCLDESVNHNTRRNALRFGRLYVYVRGGKIKSVDELEKAFQWNTIFSSSFKDMNPNQLPKAWTNELIATIPQIVKALDNARSQRDGSDSHNK